jgi:predicted O-methyltransferase YrrM
MTTRSTLDDPRVKRVLAAMHADADRVDPPLLARAKGKSLAERAVVLREAFIPVSPDAGRFLYTLVRAAQPGTVVEFGTSFGISTIYMAAALRDRGGGAIITTELQASKADRARQFMEEAGLSDLVDLRVGDALQTLRALDRDVALLFLDGAKDLYVPVLKLLEPSLKSGALVIGDDIDLFPDALATYLRYVRDPANGYVSVKVPIGDAMEVSTRA